MVALRVAHRVLILGIVGAVVSASQVPLTLHPTAKATSSRTVFTPEFSASVGRYLDEKGVPALSAGVVYVNGSTVETEFATWGNRTEDGDPLTKETLFFIGSCSKAFLSASLGILMDDFAHGKNVTALPLGVEEFTWKTKIRDLLPGEWKMRDSWATESANIIDILSHVSGLPRHDLAYGGHDTQADIVSRLRHLEPAFEFRQQYYYNNHMYVLGAQIISTYTGEPYSKFVRDRILKPLNMNSTVMSTRDVAPDDHIAHAFTHGVRRIPLLFEDEYMSNMLAGAGGILSNPVDMTKWLAMLINGGVNPHTNEVVVPKSAIDAVTTAYSIASGRGPNPDESILGYGMGWSRSTYKGHELVSHNGGLNGFLTETQFLPYDHFGINVVMSNDFAGDVPPTVVKHIIDNVLGLSRSDPNVMDSASRTKHSAAPTLVPAESLPTIQYQTPPGAPTFDLSAYEGTYTNPAYGPLSFCAPTNTSAHCTALRAEFATVNATDAPALYAGWDRVWVRHIQLLPRGGHTFELRSTTIYPHGFGKNTTPFETVTSLHDVPVVSIFDVVDGEVRGLAFPNGFEAIPVVSGKREGSLKETALVYFERA